MEERIFGLIGRRLAHSYSVPIHRALGNEHYALYELEPEALGAFLKRPDIGGLNVTIPYKRDVMAHCDELNETAREIGSVNTIVRRQDGRLAGYNTDAYGLAYMAMRAGISLGGKKVVILGSGGASLTAQYVAKRECASEIVVVSREGTDNYENLANHRDAQILINTTPVGMYPHTGEMPVDPVLFPALEGVLELIYNPRKTALLFRAQEFGIPCASGLSMLIAQAKAAEELFFDCTIADDENEGILRMMQQSAQNIVLIGMPGSGKTTVGTALARLSGRTAIDLDEQIVLAAGKPIPQIFTQDGEAAFRTLEREQAQRWGKESGMILITGGGIVKDERNYQPLAQNGRIYEIARELTLLPREGRPLSQATDLAQMQRERARLYARFRDAVVDNSETPQITAERIWHDFCAKAE
jgi:shikimate dehydrogenase